jgi:hypothetical protein
MPFILWLWGKNLNCQLGMNDTRSRLVPTQVGLTRLF